MTSLFAPRHDAKGKKRFHVVLIKPSKYDDDGYVISWFRAILVSNSLATMNALTEQATLDQVLGPDVDIVTHFYDETVTRIPVRKIAKIVGATDKDSGIICMVGVQSNQFPRAVDLGREFMAYGQKVMIGGFHVSGSIEMLPNPVAIAELAVDKQAATLLMPVAARRGLNDLPDDIWTKINIEFYSDPADGVFKGLQE